MALKWAPAFSLCPRPGRARNAADLTAVGHVRVTDHVDSRLAGFRGVAALCPSALSRHMKQLSESSAPPRAHFVIMYNSKVGARAEYRREQSQRIKDSPT